MTPINRVYWKQISIHGTTMANRREFAAISKLVINGEIEPIIDRTFSLEEAPAALERMDSGDQFGKIVLTTRATE